MKTSVLIRLGLASWLAAIMVCLSACSGQGASTAASAPVSEGTASAAGKQAKAPADAPASQKQIVIGVDAYSVPLTFWDERTKLLSGYDADMAREAFKRAGLAYEFKAIVWADKEKELKSKNIDVVWSGLTITDERAKDFAFSVPYYSNRQAILVRADSAIQGKEDLRGKAIGEHKGSPSKAFIQSLGPARHEEYLELPDLFAAVMNGQIDAAITDGVFIDYYALHTPGKFRVLSDSVPEKGFAVGMDPANKELLTQINKALMEMEADGTAKAIYRQWFAEKSQ
ncbi:MAG: transporter substrate-binding domain-containing protein [Brachymonas sp.]|nr:transporter substrate-binding domain-containing protein [Brachymonas sp.]